jgi:DNA-binding response OmpR family regulator
MLLIATVALPRYRVYVTMEPFALLIIARSQSLAKHLRDALDAEQYLIRWVASSAQALHLDVSPSLLILDLPSSGGARSVTRLKRRFDAPLLVLLPADQAVPDQADGYLFRPYAPERLVERIETILMDASPHVLCVAEMSLDTDTRRLQINGTFFQLPPLGCRIMAVLMSRAGQVISRDELFRRVWRIDDLDGTRALDVHIAHLRHQLEADSHHPKLILTERGLGYRLQPPEPR